MKISLCLTTFNRVKLLLESFAQVMDDERISEIIISDDASPADIFNQIEIFALSNPKVKMFRNDTNLDCARNKRQAIKRAANQYAILLDSDNRIDTSYLDAIYSAPWRPDTIVQPVFARPHFNFYDYAGKTINRSNVHEFIDHATFQTALNASNYFVDKDEYLRVFDPNVDPVTSDSIYQAYNWLNAGNSIYFAPGMEYYHRVEDHGNEEQSHYKTKHRSTPRGFHDSILEKLKAMR